MNKTPTDLNLKITINKLDTLKSQLVLSDVLKEKITHLYQRIIEKNIIKGRSTDAMIAATIYVVCRDSETTHTLNDIIKVTGIRKKSIAKCYRAILATLNLQMPIPNINQYALRIANDMGLSEKVKLYATDILNDAKKRNHLAGKDPMGVAAAAIYLASIDVDEKISQRKLAKTALITEVTIRNRCKGLRTIN